MAVDQRICEVSDRIMDILDKRGIEFKFNISDRREEIRLEDMVINIVMRPSDQEVVCWIDETKHAFQRKEYSVFEIHIRLLDYFEKLKENISE